MFLNYFVQKYFAPSFLICVPRQHFEKQCFCNNVFSFEDALRNAELGISLFYQMDIISLKFCTWFIIFQSFDLFFVSDYNNAYQIKENQN